MYKVTKIYPSERQFTCLSPNHDLMLKQYMEQIENWVYDPQSDKVLQLNIHSYSLQKALEKQVKKVYLNQGVFVDFKRNFPDVKVKKAKGFRQSNFLRGFARANSQTDSQKVPELGFCDSQEVLAQDEAQNEEDQILNETSQTGSEESKGKSLKSSGSIGVSMKSSQQAIFKQKLQTYDTLTPELKNLVDIEVRQEMGFTSVIELMILSKKPMVGHNMIHDLVYIYNQFIDVLPDSYLKFAEDFNKKFPKIYDSRSLACNIQQSAAEKTELRHLYMRALKDKKYANNVTIILDKEKDPRFGTFYNPKSMQVEGQEHDAGFDSYMTGHIFACYTKYFEIG